jgi:hypothetical protein
MNVKLFVKPPANRLPNFLSLLIEMCFLLPYPGPAALCPRARRVDLEKSIP